MDRLKTNQEGGKQMKIIIEAEPKEIADLVRGIQNRQQATKFELWYLDERKKAWDKIHSRETSPPLSK
jgi:hypothetical protein